jgi:phosphatidylserine decarboxylase
MCDLQVLQQFYMFEYRANNWRLTRHYQSAEQMHLDSMLLQAQIYPARFNYDVVATTTETSHNYSKHNCMCTWYCKLQCRTKSFGSF